MANWEEDWGMDWGGTAPGETVEPPAASGDDADSPGSRPQPDIHKAIVRGHILRY